VRCFSLCGSVNAIEEIAINVYGKVRGQGANSRYAGGSGWSDW
jgi:hypothetical protein